MRGLEVSPCSLGQDLFVDREIRARSPELLVLLLQPLQFFQLPRAHPAILLAPALIGLFGDTHLTDRINARRPLPNQDINLA